MRDTCGDYAGLIASIGLLRYEVLRTEQGDIGEGPHTF
jgi:hypothetical protein